MILRQFGKVDGESLGQSHLSEGSHVSQECACRGLGPACGNAGLGVKAVQSVLFPTLGDLRGTFMAVPG